MRAVRPQTLKEDQDMLKAPGVKIPPFSPAGLSTFKSALSQHTGARPGSKRGGLGSRA